MDKMVVMKSWLESAREKMDKIDYAFLCMRILDYGLFEDSENTDWVTVDVPFDLIAPQITRMQENYNEKVNKGDKGGRPVVADSIRVWKLAQEKKTAAEIAEVLGIKPSTVYSCEGWKQRKNVNFLDSFC